MLFLLWELRDDPAAAGMVAGIVLLGLVIGFTIHEFCHALAALGEGDPTARRMGRLTFNPVKHIDPLGFILILTIGFGWAKPVQVDPYNLRHGRLGMSWVALVGPLSNFALAFLLGLVFRLGVLSLDVSQTVYEITGLLSLAMFFIIYLNLVLGIVNLIPFPPLDGSKVLAGLLPESLYYRYLMIERYVWFLLIGVVVVNLILSYSPLGFSLLSYVIQPPARFFFTLATGETPF